MVFVNTARLLITRSLRRSMALNGPITMTGDAFPPPWAGVCIAPSLHKAKTRESLAHNGECYSRSSLLLPFDVGSDSERSATSAQGTPSRRELQLSDWRH